jgi:hypothetical protein
MAKQTVYLVLWLMVLFAAFVICESVFSTSFHKCMADNQKNETATLESSIIITRVGEMALGAAGNRCPEPYRQSLRHLFLILIFA